MLDKIKDWLSEGDNKDLVTGFAVIGVMISLAGYAGKQLGNNEGYYEGFERGYKNGIRDICSAVEEVRTR